MASCRTEEGFQRSSTRPFERKSKEGEGNLHSQVPAGSIYSCRSAPQDARCREGSEGASERTAFERASGTSQTPRCKGRQDLSSSHSENPSLAGGQDAFLPCQGGEWRREEAEDQAQEERVL